MDFRDQDLAHLAERGIAESEARRQLELLRRPPRPVVLDRPCSVGDGVVALSAAQQQTAIVAGRALVDAGRVTKFVPASGAATRMFQALIAASGGSDRPSSAAAVAQFFQRFDAFPFAPQARAAAAVTGPIDDEARERAILDAVLNAMEYAALPKGLITFHHGNPPRTAFEEQLREGVPYTRSSTGLCRMHFTVVPEARDRFVALLEAVRGPIEHQFQCQLRVTFSEQQPSTDTLAIDAHGEPFRTSAGDLLLRPAGHGALIENLQALDGDVVVIKNIDNILPAPASDEVIRWKFVLLGVLEELEAERQRERSRPLRVCGVVRNEGEPGGAPFWVRAADGSLSVQIVESAQVDMSDPLQKRIFESATHFNPVDVVGSLRDSRGRPFDLSQFVDPSAAFISKKSFEGRELTALERPGLWNGAMAGWDTVCVEVPAQTFAPVKTVLDLLRPQHQ